MKFENTQVFNFEGAFRGLRNPMNSWSKSDSEFGIEYTDDVNEIRPNAKILRYSGDSEYAEFVALGSKDLDLAQRMIKAGSSDAKFLRQIFVSVDITGPEYWWAEMDTYKISTTANSTSKMHKLSSTPITLDCFERDDYNNVEVFEREPYNINDDTDIIWEDIINICETLRKRYYETKDQRYWKELIRILPESWLQTRTWTANYAVLRNIYQQRKSHRLIEWHSFCDWIKTLPYAQELILFN